MRIVYIPSILRTFLFEQVQSVPCNPYWTSHGSLEEHFSERTPCYLSMYSLISFIVSHRTVSSSMRVLCI